MKKIIIIGGGISGVVSAIKSKTEDNEVIILEKNKDILKKLLITGSGRCNYKNETTTINNYVSNNHELIEEVINDDNIQLMNSFYQELGLIPRIKDGYYYPYSNQAITIKNLLLNELKGKKIKVLYNTKVIDINYNNKYEIICDDNVYIADTIVLATGSLAYPKLGSTGFGYQILEKFGHTIIKPLPALVPLISDYKHCKEWIGVRYLGEVSLYIDNQLIKKEKGEIQFTKDGISGICIFNLSNYLTRNIEHNIEIAINFMPDDYVINKNKTIYEILMGFLNMKLIPIILKESSLDSSKKYNELTLEEDTRLLNTLTNFKIHIIKTKDYNEAQICNGGIKIDEVNLTTMESKIMKNLYITGELLDINGNCGGYNLTLCVITAIKAGEDILKNKN